MSLEEIARDMYRTEETIAFDGKFKEMLNLDSRVVFDLGKLEYENIAYALVRYAREFGFFVGVKKDRLQRESHMTPSTYSSMLDYGYVSVAGTVNNIDIITPTQKLLKQGNVLPKTKR